MTIAINKLEEHIGARVRGVDLTCPIDDDAIDALRNALFEHSVLVFNNQEITDEQHVAFTRRLGTLQMTMASDPYGGGGPINRFTNVDENGDIIPPDDARSLYQAGNTLWHSDGAFKHVPLRASLLSAKVIPPERGETEYASLRAAYAALSKEKKAELEGLIAEHSIAHSRTQIGPSLMSKAWLKETPPVQHVVVRSIPETGEKVLFVGSYATRIIGWPVEKGRALLEELLEWSTQRQFVYRHVWQVDDLVIYDNRSCLHRGRPWDSGTYKRILHRTTLAGDGPTVAQE